MADISAIEYEPPDRPASTLNARREFLLAVARLVPQAIDDLFIIPWRKFLEAAHHKQLLGTDSHAPASVLPYPDFAKKQYHEELKTDPSTNRVMLLLSRESYLAHLDYQRSLEKWSESYNLNADWCREFGRQVHVDFHEKRKDWKPGRLQLREWKQQFLETPKPPPLILPRIFFPSATKADLPPEADASKEKEIEDYIEKNDAADTLRWGKAALIAWDISQKEHIRSWKNVVGQLLQDAELKLVVPEEKFQNKYDRPFAFLTGSKLHPKPEALRLKPPVPPQYLPPIIQGLHTMTSRQEYERRIKTSINEHLQTGITKLVPSAVLQRWEKQVFDHCKPLIDRYWQEYQKHLRSQGWIKTIEKKELRAHCEWLVYYAVMKWKQEQIAKKFGGKMSLQNVSNRIREVNRLIDLDLGERRGKR